VHVSVSFTSVNPREGSLCSPEAPYKYSIITDAPLLHLHPALSVIAAHAKKQPYLQKLSIITNACTSREFRVVRGRNHPHHFWCQNLLRMAKKNRKLSQQKKKWRQRRTTWSVSARFKANMQSHDAVLAHGVSRWGIAGPHENPYSLYDVLY
jgi:hypothetical protein